MNLRDRLRGRKERRLPIGVVVNIAALELVNAERHERTYIDNISARGARVHTTYAWELGEEIEISGEPPMRGEVAYCQRLDNGRFFVGINFRESHIPWSVLRRFDGLELP